MYRVIKRFRDVRDNRHEYNVGDEYPRDGKTVSKARIAELSGSKNKQGVPLIEKVDLNPATPPVQPNEAGQEEASPNEEQPVDEERPKRTKKKQ